MKKNDQRKWYKVDWVENIPTKKTRDVYAESENMAAKSVSQTEGRVITDVILLEEKVQYIEEE